MTIAKLFARIGVDADTKKVKDFSKGLKTVLIGLTAATTFAIGFSVALKKISDEAFKAAVELKQFTFETGASAEELQKWQAIAEQTNQSASSVAASVKAIALNQEKIKLGQGNISGYQLLGIDPYQDPFEILTQLRTKLEGLDQGMKKHVLSMIGVSSDLLQVLELSNDQFDIMGKQAFIIPKGQIEIMNKAQSSVAVLTQGLKWLKAQIAVELSPNIVKLNKEIAKWIRNNKEGVIKTVKIIFMWVHKFVTSIINASKMIDIIVRKSIGWKNAMYGLIAVIALLNASLLLSPIGLVIAGIILLVAVLDDLYIYSTGKGKSMFGLLMEKFPELEEKLFNFLNIIKDVRELMGFLFKGDTKGIEKMIQKMGLLGKVIILVFEYMKTMFKFMSLQLKLLFMPLQALIDLIVIAAQMWNKELGTLEGLKAMKDVFVKRGKETVQDIVGFGKAAKESYSNVTNAFSIKVDVKTGSGDPTLIADEINKTMQQAIETASDQIARNE